MPDDLTPERDELAGEYRSLTTDIAIGLGPTAAVVANHLLKKGDKPKADPPPQEPKK